LNLLLAGALGLSLQVTPGQFGRDVGDMGACEAFGWSHDMPAMRALAEEMSTQPGQSPQDFRAVVADALSRRHAEFEAELTAIATQEQARAYLRNLADRCDALTRDYPGILMRTGDTQSTLDTLSARVIPRYPE